MYLGLSQLIVDLYIPGQFSRYNYLNYYSIYMHKFIYINEQMKIK